MVLPGAFFVGDGDGDDGDDGYMKFSERILTFEEIKP